MKIENRGMMKRSPPYTVSGATGAIIGRLAISGAFPRSAFSVLGVGFGDIGTSPLYTLKTVLGVTVDRAFWHLEEPSLEFSKLCKDIDERVNPFLDRPIKGQWPYLWLDATQLKVRDGGRIISVAAIIPSRGQDASWSLPR